MKVRPYDSAVKNGILFHLIIKKWKTSPAPIVHILDRSKYPIWASISRDGVFYESNSNERLLSGDVPFERTQVFGLNSYEGTLGELSYGWMESSFTPEMVKNVFATCKGFSVFQNFNMNSLWSFISRSLKVNCHLWLENRWNLRFKMYCGLAFTHISG